MRKIACVLTVVALTFMAGTASSQFGALKKAISPTGSSGDGEAVSSESLIQGWKKVSENYIKSSMLMVSSLENAGAALGVKEEVVKKMADVRALSSGNLTKDNINKVRASTTEAQKIIADKMNETSSLKGNSGMLFSKSLSDLANSLTLKIEVGIEATSLSKNSISALKKTSLDDCQISERSSCWSHGRWNSDTSRN